MNKPQSLYVMLVYLKRYMIVNANIKKTLVVSYEAKVKAVGGHFMDGIISNCS